MAFGNENDDEVIRAYSMASYPAEEKELCLMFVLLHLLGIEIKMIG